VALSNPLTMKLHTLVSLLALAVVLLAAGCCSSSSDIAASAPATQAPSSDTTKAATVAAEKTTSAPKTTAAPKLEVSVGSITPYADSSGFMTPKPGYKYVLVDFALKNNGYPNGFNFNPIINPKLKDADGYSYTYSLISGSVPGYFGGTTIAQGETARGKLVFEVPDKQSTYVLLVE